MEIAESTRSGTNSEQPHVDAASEASESVTYSDLHDASGEIPETIFSAKESQDALSISGRQSIGLEDIRSSRRLMVEAQRKNIRPIRRKHRVQYCLKFIGLPSCIIVTIFLVSFILLFGLPGDKKDTSDSESVDYYQIQRVVPGSIVSLSQSGDFAAVKNDFGFTQVYRKSMVNDTRVIWEPVGQTITTLGRLGFSANGTTIAYIERRSRRPEIRHLVEKDNIWISQKAPIIIGDDISIDATATLMTVALFDRQLDQQTDELVDMLVTFEFDGDEWIQHSDRIILERVQSFDLSPAASDLVVTTATNTSVDLIHLYHLSGNGSDPVWESLAEDVTIAGEILSLSLAEATFVMTAVDHVQVYSYSGRPLGQKLEPTVNTTLFTSAALNLEGTAMALASLDTTSGASSGVVHFYSFPDYLDTSDAWEENTDAPPLTAEWLSQDNGLRDEYGAAAPYFGSAVKLDALADQIIVQSGADGGENVHFYGLFWG